jgi:hypothetical protein
MKYTQILLHYKGLDLWEKDFCQNLTQSCIEITYLKVTTTTTKNPRIPTVIGDNKIFIIRKVIRFKKGSYIVIVSCQLSGLEIYFMQSIALAFPRLWVQFPALKNKKSVSSPQRHCNLNACDVNNKA